MSLIDVFQGKQSLLGWITGRDPKEADVYANYDKVQTTSDNIRSIAKNQVLTAQESIYAAFNQLNSVKGLAEYVGTIEVGNYDTVFTSGVMHYDEEVEFNKKYNLNRVLVKMGYPLIDDMIANYKEKKSKNKKKMHARTMKGFLTC